MTESPFTILNPSGDAIRGDLRFARGETWLPALIVCHGFTAHKDWGPFPGIGRRFAVSGFASVVFNSSHNGIGANFRRFTEREKFSRNTVAKELEDVRALTDAIAEGRFGRGVIDPARVGIVGHSRGAGVAVLSASLDNRIRGVAAWSSIATFQRYTAHQRQVWKEQGYLPVTIRGSRTNLRFGIEVLRDLEEHKDRYDLKKAVRTLQVPLLLVHGSADVSVRLAEAEELYAVSDRTRTEFVVLEGVGHALGATHPTSDPNPTMDRVVALTARWFERFL